MKINLKILIILIGFNTVYSQEIYVGKFENTPATFKSTNEPIGNVTIMQLQIKKDSTYIFESYVYNKFDRKRQKINCTEQKGNWSQKNNLITFFPINNESASKAKQFSYQIVNDKKLYFVGSGKKYAKKTKLIKTKALKKISCHNISKKVEPGW